MATSKKAPEKAKGEANGRPGGSTLAEAMAYEENIATQARTLRTQFNDFSPPELFLQLWPLLRAPIPQGFITTEPATKGKPYPSTGIKSVQVCIDRLDNVLTPFGWRERVEYEEAGKLCTVTVDALSSLQAGVLAADVVVLVRRSSKGGVNQGSTTGNIYKGSYTNAAKRAFAMLGVGHEVYLGATDLDPDVSADAAKAQEKGDAPVSDEPIGTKRADVLGELLEGYGLESSQVAMKLRSFGVKALSDLSEGQALRLHEWGIEQANEG